MSMRRRLFFVLFVAFLSATTMFAQNNFEKNYQVEGTARKVGQKFECFIYKGFDEPCAVVYTVSSSDGTEYSNLKLQISYRKGYVYSGFVSDRFFTVKIEQVIIFDDEGNIKDQEILSEGEKVSVKAELTPIGKVATIILFPITLASDVYVRNVLSMYNFNSSDIFSNFTADFDIGFKNTWISHVDIEYGFSYRDGNYSDTDLTTKVHDYGVHLGAFYKVLNNKKSHIFNPYIGVTGHYYFTDSSLTEAAPAIGFTLGWKYVMLDFRYSQPFMFASRTFDLSGGYIQGGICVKFQPTPFSLFSKRHISRK